MCKQSFVIFFLALLSCSPPVKKNIASDIQSKTPSYMQKTYVESVEIDANYSGTGEIKFIVYGQLPSPAYKLDIVDVAVEEKNVFLTPYAYYQQKTSTLQVLIPFQTSVIVKLDSPGEYKIHLIGRASTLQKNFTYN